MPHAGSGRTVTIGNVSAFWGDTPFAVPQVLGCASLDFLVGDYLAEITMSLLARARQRDPHAGYVPDFVEAFGPHLGEIGRRGIRVVINAGGLAPDEARRAFEAAAARAGVRFEVATVTGDDLLPRLAELRERRLRDMFTDAPFPERPLSMNAYLGARPIAAALDAGAEVVITGRCNDAALVLGPLMHAHGWSDADHDLLAGGSLAGHVIECGTQCTGGAFTDWETVPGWDDVGFPVVECAADGTFVVTKAPGTGGLVTPATVAEQMLYEIGDPAAYVLPDVVCDFTDVVMEQDGPDRVRVAGARGRAPTPSYKVSATYEDGFRVSARALLVGEDAEAKARRVADALFARTRRLGGALGYADFTETSVSVLGAEELYGATRRIAGGREVMLEVAARHRERAPLALLGRELIACATSTAQGITGFSGGRPQPSPVVCLFSFLVPKTEVPIAVEVGGRRMEVRVSTGSALEAPPPRPVGEVQHPVGETREVPLLRLAYARSGDKGGDANIGVLCRRPEDAPLLRAQLTAEAVKAFFSHLVHGEVERFELPGVHGWNFVLHDALGGGGVASLRPDPQGKGLGQMLLSLPIRVPAHLER